VTRAPPGRGGDLTVVASDAITIAGRDQAGNASGLFSSTTGRGPGGDLQVVAPHLQLSDGGTISAHSSGDGDAGTLRLQVGDTFRSQNGAVTTATEGAGGGAIALTAGRLVQLIDSELTTSARCGGGDAGNISLDAPFVLLEGSRIIANAFEGRGGNIRIEAGVFLADPASRVEASSALGISGTVDIRAPVTSLSGTLAPLPQAFVSAAELLPARCVARVQGGKASTLVVRGRDGLPLDPGGLLPSPLALDIREGTDPAGTGESYRQNPISRFALLANDDKVFPRMRGWHVNGVSPMAPDLGCSKSLGERQADRKKSR
jgi:large exoprotein involved in heme utilization and adhesion